MDRRNSDSTRDVAAAQPHAPIPLEPAESREPRAARRHAATAGRADGITPYAYSLFQQPWWLEAVAPGNWRELVVMRGSEVAARMPIVLHRRWGLDMVAMPPLTQTLGPWLRPSGAKYGSALREQKELLTELITQIEPNHYFRQHLCPEVTYWLPFYWAGYSVAPAVTYRIEDLTDLDAVKARFLHNVRGEIRKASSRVAVRDDLGIERFLDVHRKTFARQGMKLPYDEAVVLRVEAACAARGVRRILFAEDAAGQIHAAVYIVWDSRTCYLLMSGADPALRTSGAVSLVAWHAIQHAAAVSACFDFEGSMLEGVERFFRAFGGRQRTYMQVHKMSRFVRTLNGVREVYASACSLGARSLS